VVAVVCGAGAGWGLVKQERNRKSNLLKMAKMSLSIISFFLLLLVIVVNNPHRKAANIVEIYENVLKSAVIKKLKPLVLFYYVSK
jgi:hypothetical protein